MQTAKTIDKVKIETTHATSLGIGIEATFYQLGVGEARRHTYTYNDTTLLQPAVGNGKAIIAAV